MKELAASIISVLIISSIIIQGCMGEIEDVTRSIRDTYSKLVKAEERGADVRDAAMKLEKALELVKEAEEHPEKRDALLSEARKLVEEVESSIPILIENGERRIFWRNLTIAFAVVMIALSALLTYYYGPRIFWTLWLRIRSHWIMEIIEREKESDRRRS
ncbi:MAG: hypothetical protein DRN49_04975 [Thaumarchaeota archaeon]|nr:MAG: hypothetical protein DRN49_04975 [Nitrososphaerota archaeon]